jgi:hypothetical protein
LAVLIAPTALMGCVPEPFEIAVSGGLEQPVLELKRQGGIAINALCVRAIHVVRDAPRQWPTTVSDSDAVWRVVSPDGRCTSLRRLTYGAAIPRLETVAPARALSPGVRYLIWGEAAGRHRGAVVVLFEQGAWKVVPHQSVDAVSDAG